MEAVLQGKSNFAVKGTPSLGRTLVAGVVAGVVSALLANVVAWLISTAADIHLKTLTFMAITFASLIPNIVGSAVYYFLSRRTTRPTLIYTVIAVVLATLDTVLVSVNPPEPGFGIVADPLHYVVALSSVILIPLIAKR